MAPVTDAAPTLRDLFTEALEIWRQATNGPEYDAIWPILDQAAGFGREAFDVSLYFLQADDVVRRAVSADLMGRLARTKEEFREQIAEAINDRLGVEEDVDVIWSLLTAVGPTQSVRPIPRLIEYSGSPTAPFRLQGIRSLGTIYTAHPDQASAAQAIVRAMEDLDDSVRAEATSLAALQLPLDAPTVADALGRRLFDAYDPARLLAIHGLALRRDVRAVSAIRYALEGESVPGRVFASALVLAEPSLVPYLEKANRSSLDDERYKMVVEACRNGVSIV